MKKVLKSKKIILVLLLIDIFVLIYLFYNKYYSISIILILVNIFSMSLILKHFYDVSLFNYERSKNLIYNRKIKKKLTKKERYLEKINLKTFDGSGGVTHPCILKFENNFNGYKYWLVCTPYDDNNTELENPCIYVSNDGKNFIKPDGVKEPLLPIVKRYKNKPAEYYNDPFFLFENNELEVWFRYTIEDKSSKDIPLINKIYRIKSKDGINWTEPQLMINDDGSWYLSPSIIKIDNNYYFYYFDQDLKFYCKTSKDLKKWSNPNLVNVKNFTDNYWHGEVKLINKKVYFLFLSKDYKLYFGETSIDNPFNFKECQELNFYYYDRRFIYGNLIKYKSTFLIEKEYLNFYIPFRINEINWFKYRKMRHLKWTLTNTFININKLDLLLKKKN